MTTAEEPTPYDAVLLAGGRARRLEGADKPGLRVAGRPLVWWSAVAAGGARRLIVVGPRRPELPGAVFVRENPPGAGPIPALRTGLAEVGSPWVVLLATDLPFLRPAHVAELRRRAGEGSGAVLVDEGGRPQWLVGAWRTGPLRAALSRYDRASLGGLLGPLDPIRVSLPAGARPPWYDCDSAEALARARRLGGGTMLDEWTEAACVELGLETSELDRDLILDMARDVAHGVARPAAPLTAYLMGLAVGRGAPARDVAARIAALAGDWKA